MQEGASTGLDPAKGVVSSTESGGPNRKLGGKKDVEAKEASAYDDLEARFAALKKR